MRKIFLVLAFAYGSTAAAQDRTADSLNAVTSYSLKSGTLMLTSLAHPKPVSLPDGKYKNDGGVILAILDGRVAHVEDGENNVTAIASMHFNRQRAVMLTPSTNALMSVADMTLPSGVFTSEDGKTSFTVISGRPTVFTLETP